jgi:hypothetical protein
MEMYLPSSYIFVAWCSFFLFSTNQRIRVYVGESCLSKYLNGKMEFCVQMKGRISFVCCLSDIVVWHFDDAIEFHVGPFIGALTTRAG